MARKTSAKRLIANLEAETAIKVQLKAILEVLAGTKEISEACAELGVSEATFHRLKEKALEGAVEALVPKPAGRPAKTEETPTDVEELKRQLLVARMELEASRVREEIALVMPHLLKRNEKKSPKQRPSVQELFDRKGGTKPS
jgi:transposase-like protein